MDIRSQLNSLMEHLVRAGYDRTDAADLVAEASRIISDRIADAVAAAVSEAEQAAVDKGATDFLAELGVGMVGNDIMIKTDSGRTDFSEPPFPMLSRLLRGGKIAKDGSIYKRIPIPQNKQPSDTKQKMAQSVMAASQQRQVQLDAAKAAIEEENSGGWASLPDPLNAAQSFGDMYRASRGVRKTSKAEGRKKATGPVDIRTASSKQNPASQWVLPPKDYDMTATLGSINSDLRSTIEQIVSSVIAECMGMV